MSLRALSRRLAITAALAGCAVALTAPASAGAVELPPELAALEQRMAQLQITSARFDFQEEVADNESGTSGIPFGLIIAGRGESSVSPAQISLEAGLLGTTEERTRVLGETEWIYERHAQELDGGRPWVRRKRAKAQSPNGLDPGGLLQADTSGTTSTFGKLIEELGEAQTLVDSGPVTVDDQRVTEFEASINPAPLIAQLEAQAKSNEPTPHPLESLFPEAPRGPAKGSPKSFPAPTLELEVFLAASGLPVRVRLTFSAQGDTFSIRLDTLAINVPVDVAPPPAKQTIGERKLKKLERRSEAIARKKLLRTCKHLKGKSARECRAVANGGGKESGSESSLL